MKPTSWPHRLPRTPPETSYEYVKEQIITTKLNHKILQTNHLFRSEHNTFYIRFSHNLTEIYRMSFSENKERINDFLVWLNDQD
jgi:hypothetical protein